MSEGLPKVGGQSVRLAGLGFALLFGACGQPASNADYGALNSSLSAGDTQLHGRINPGMAVDAAHHELVLFGGYRPGNPQAPLDDTWIYRDGSWRAIHQTVAPDGRYGPSMAWDPRGAQVLLYGGRGGRGDFTDTWAWNGISWKRLSGGSSELFSGFATMATDPMRGQVVLHVAGRSAIESWVWWGRLAVRSIRAWASRRRASCLRPAEWWSDQCADRSHSCRRQRHLAVGRHQVAPAGQRDKWTLHKGLAHGHGPALEPYGAL
jgi:hypothetical protein